MPWADIDHRDGFMHLSAADQVRDTVRLHFADTDRITLVAIDPGGLEPETLRWEPSRGGLYFPHVYGQIRPLAVESAITMERGSGGAFEVGPELPDPLPDDPDPRALVRRFEQVEAGGAEAYVRAAVQTLGRSDVRSLRCGAAIACDYGPGSPLSVVKAWGLGGEEDLVHLDTFERFFAETSTPCVVETTGYAEELLGPLQARGYQLVATEHVFARRLEPGAGDDTLGGGAVELEAIDDVDAWAHAQAVGFTGDPPPPMFVDFGRQAASAQRSVGAFIRFEGRRVGTCGDRIDHDVQWLYGATVSEAERGRGLQVAAMFARMERGRALGCRWAKLDTAPGTASHRNALRAGFHVAYTRLVFAKPDST